MDTLSLKSLKTQLHPDQRLPKRELWVVKLVQAAVACGAERVKISFGMCQVSVSFENVAGWRASEILDVLESSTADRSLGHVASGLRASLDGFTDGLSWTCGGQTVLVDSRGCETIPAAPASEVSFEASHPCRSLSLDCYDRSISHLARHTLEEYEAVKTHCSVCPIPIFLDGDLMKTAYSSMHREELEQRLDSRVARFLGLAVFLCLGVKPIKTPIGRPDLPYQPAEAERERRAVFHGETFLEWETSATQCQGAVALLMDGHAESRIDYVLDGAVVHSQILDNWSVDDTSSVAARFIVGVHPQEVGPNGFSVPHLDSEPLLEAAIPELRRLTRTVLANLDLLWPIPFRRHEITPYCGTASIFKLSTLIAAGKTLSLGLVGGYVVGGTGFVLGCVCSAWRMTIELQLEAFLKSLEQKLPLEDRS